MCRGQLAGDVTVGTLTSTIMMRRTSSTKALGALLFIKPTCECFVFAIFPCGNQNQRGEHGSVRVRKSAKTIIRSVCASPSDSLARFQGSFTHRSRLSKSQSLRSISALPSVCLRHSPIVICMFTLDSAFWPPFFLHN